MCSRDAARLKSADTSPGKAKNQYYKFWDIFHGLIRTPPAQVFDSYNLTLSTDEIEECFIHAVDKNKHEA